MSLAWVSRWVELVVPSKMELLLYWVRVRPRMPPIAIATQIDCHKLFLLHDLHIFAWLYDFSSFSCMIPIRLSWAMWRHLVTNKIQTRLRTWMLFYLWPVWQYCSIKVFGRNMLCWIYPAVSDWSSARGKKMRNEANLFPPLPLICLTKYQFYKYEIFWINLPQEIHNERSCRLRFL